MAPGGELDGRVASAGPPTANKQKKKLLWAFPGVSWSAARSRVSRYSRAAPVVEPHAWQELRRIRRRRLRTEKGSAHTMDEERNPFTLPSDEEVFKMRDEERKRRGPRRL